MSTPCFGPASSTYNRIQALIPGFQLRLNEARGTFPSFEMLQLGKCGGLRAPLPECDGGEGWGLHPGTYRDLLFTLHNVGSANLALGRIFEGHVNALQLVARYGTKAQIKQLAANVINNNAVYGVWNTGPQGKPSIVPIGDGTFQLIGGKTFASGVGKIDGAIVTGNLLSRWQMAIVPLRTAHLKIDESSWEPFGMEGSNSFHVDFTGTQLPSSALLGEVDDYYREPYFTAGAIRFASVQLGAANSLLHFLRDFLLETGRSDDPHQLARLGRIAVAVQSGKQWIAEAAEWLDTPQQFKSLPTRAHMMRTAAEQICMDVMSLVEVSIGARGLLAGQPFSRMLRDLRMYLRQAGVDNALTSIGRSLFAEDVQI